MDFAFGTAGLNFNQDPPHGLADAVMANQKMDQTMLDRLMSKAANHINLLAAPVMLDRTYDFGERDFEQVVELSQKTMPVVILDIPHVWNAWTRHTLATVDEIVIVAEPDLANLRNAKNIGDTVKALRPTEVAAAAGHQQGRHAAPSRDQRRRSSRPRSSASCSDHPVRGAGLRHRRQQRPDDRRGRGQQPRQRDLPPDRHAGHRPRTPGAAGKSPSLKTAFVPQAQARLRVNQRVRDVW